MKKASSQNVGETASHPFERTFRKTGRSWSIASSHAVRELGGFKYIHAALLFGSVHVSELVVAGDIALASGNVNQAIRRALDKIDLIEPELAAHLRATLSWGHYVKYHGTENWRL